MGAGFADQGRRDEARDAYDRAVAIDPAAVPASLRMLGDLYREDGDYVRAEETMRQLIAAPPRQPLGAHRARLALCHHARRPALARRRGARAPPHRLRQRWQWQRRAATRRRAAGGEAGVAAEQRRPRPLRRRAGRPTAGHAGLDRLRRSRSVGAYPCAAARRRLHRRRLVGAPPGRVVVPAARRVVRLRCR